MKIYKKNVIPIEKINLDNETQGRLEIKEEHVCYLLEKTLERLGDSIDKTLAQLDEIKVFTDNGKLWLVDGYHRLEAAKRAGCSHIKAYTADGTLEEARWTCLTLNDKQCLPLTSGDKRNIVRKALAHPRADKMTDRDIAKHCHVSHTFVAQLRDTVATDSIGNERISSDGRTYRPKESKLKRKPMATDSIAPVVTIASQQPPMATVATAELTRLHCSTCNCSIEENPDW